jgi:hypothetical protein
MMLCAGDIVQLAGRHASLFEFSACLFLVSMLILVLLAYGLKKLELPE